MTKERMIKEIKAYLIRIVWINDYLTVYKSVSDASVEYNNEINMAPAFFQISLDAIRYSFCMELAKLYGKSENEGTIKGLIKLIRNNKNLFPTEVKEGCYWFEGDLGNPVDIKSIDIAEELSKYEKDLEELESIVQKVRGRRNRCLAHNDKKYFINPEQVARDFPLNFDEATRLVNFGEDFCNNMLAYLSDQRMYCKSSNANDLNNLLWATRNREK